MKLYSENEHYKLYHGNMLDMLEVVDENSIDSIVTDPPYGLTSIVNRFGKEDSAEAQYGKDGSFQRLSKGFMGKEWDGSGIEYNINAWRNCYKALKPGGYLLAFGGSRTFHRIACAIEDAGFEIRDTIMWLYGSGFPKSLNIGLAIDKKNGVESKVIATMDAPDLHDVGTKQKELGNGHIQSFGQITNAERLEYEIKEAQNEWKGWGTALKPSYEPIIIARKPVENTVVENVLKYGVGGINIDECRVEYGNETDKRIGTDAVNTNKAGFWTKDKNNGQTQMYKDNGRFPANTIFTYDDDFKDEAGVLRYFYCAKASKKDRDDGLDEFEEKNMGTEQGREIHSRGCKYIENGKLKQNPHLQSSIKKNIHPTVKPMELMQYLIRLVTPKGGVILDPFNGSGSTGKAAMYENAEKNKEYKYIGIELTEEYLPISKARIESVNYKKIQTSLL